MYNHNVPPWWNWNTQQVEGLCPKGRAGSSPVGGIDNCLKTALIGPFFYGIIRAGLSLSPAPGGKILYAHWGANVRACRRLYYTRIVNDVKKTARSQTQGAVETLSMESQ